MDFVGLMINGYYFVMSIYAVPLDSEKGDTIEFQFQNFQRRKTIAIILFYIYGSLCGFDISLFRKIYQRYAYVDTFITEFSL
jgi:hypothetical protein